MRFCFYVIYLAFIFNSCVPPTDSQVTDVDLDIKSALRQTLISLQDRQNTDSLLLYFNHPSPQVRYHAVMAFASTQDKKGIDSLISKLKDPVLEVRAAAAFALGQIGDNSADKALVAAFSTKDTINVDNIFNQNILEALGKTSSKKVAKMIASVNSYRVSDVRLVLGQMRALHRFGQRDIITEEGTQTAINYLVADNFPIEVRILAANYLARFLGVNIANSTSQLMGVLENEENVYIRMALATALGKTGAIEIAERYRSQLSKEKDYRIICNMLRQIGNFGYIENHPIAMRFINDSNPHIAECAAQFFEKHGIPEDAAQYVANLKDSTHWNARAILHGALLKNAPLYNTREKTYFKDLIVSQLDSSKHEYEKAAWIKALGNDPYQYQTLIDLYSKLASPVTKSACIEALGALMNHEGFAKAYGENQFKIKYVIVQFLKNQCKTGDVGAIASTAAFITNNTNIPKAIVIDSTWIPVSLSKLKMPRDIEAYLELKKCEAYLNGVDYVKPVIAHNQAVDFSKFNLVGDSSIVLIKTTKGNIKIHLLVDKAPVSVINFISLCNSDFFDNKPFHRVVPNFVVQAGCPRGDGFGSLDYTLRSEFSNTYYDAEGYVGMASAGPNTECSQFFITHSPTPHLDGRYTIFGKVVEGMDVVHKLHVADKIIDAIVTK